MRRLALLLPVLLLLPGCDAPSAPADLTDLSVRASPADLRPDLHRGVKAALVHAGDRRGAAALRERLTALGGFSDLLVFDAGPGTPDPLLLASYDAVLVYSVGPFDDPEVLGDRLADYVQGGGGVVAAMMTTASRDDPNYPRLYIGGLFRSGGYYALLPDSGYRGREGAPVKLGTIYDRKSPLVAGLGEFSGGLNSFRPADPRIAEGAVRVADWADGAPLVVKKSVGGRLRVDLGFFPAPDYDQTGQNWTRGGDVLLRNALLAVARH